ncbi:hypothetical protein [Roseicyclus sp.]|uniref:hypothetical protein n=1 Tax=Roseicyclus sp. TaxID=1914329 RepID=UPI001BCCB5F2|nr:hypothetical protein [Roseicyclus sp.]
MALAPFGVLNDGHKGRLTGGIHTPMYEWPGTREEFATLISSWVAEVAESLWPAWSNDGWVGGANARMTEAARAELALAVDLYHGGGDNLGILAEVPEDVPVPPDGHPRTHKWHYEIEDALVHDRKYQFLILPPGEVPSFDFRASRTIGSNYLIYEPGFDITRFETLFWGRMRGLQPPIFDIKQHFQRPRPWTAATALGVKGFRWITADGITHTGVHPAILSGHCIQGILGGCSVLDALLDELKQTGQGLSGTQIRSLQKYMVDWGDRRVFAGVHYMTDNIASWTLARRLIPHLFRNKQQVENFAVQAIIHHSQVFKDIVRHFGEKVPDRSVLDPALQMLLRDFPEANPTS